MLTLEGGITVTIKKDKGEGLMSICLQGDLILSWSVSAIFLQRVIGPVKLGSYIVATSLDNHSYVFRGCGKPTTAIILGFAEAGLFRITSSMTIDMVML